MHGITQLVELFDFGIERIYIHVAGKHIGCRKDFAANVSEFVIFEDGHFPFEQALGRVIDRFQCVVHHVVEHILRFCWSA